MRRSLLILALLLPATPAVADDRSGWGIRVEPTGSAPSVTAGRGFSYDTKISFDGPDTPDRVELVNELPVGVTVLSQDAPGGGYCGKSTDPRIVKCTSMGNQNVGPGEQWTLKVGAKLASTYVDKQLSTSVVVRAYSGDSVITTQTYTYTWDVKPAPPRLVQAEPTLFAQPRTLEVEALPSSASERTRTQFWQNWPDVQPTGFYLNAGEDLTVDLTAPDGARPVKLMIGTWGLYDQAEPSRPERPEPAFYELQPGRNTVNDPYGGIVWVQYTKPGIDGLAPPPVTIALGDAAQAIPYYRQGVTTAPEWTAMLDRSTVPWVQYSGTRTMLAVGLATAREQKSADPDALLKEYARIADAENAISGFDGSAPQHQVTPLRQLLVDSDTTTIYGGGNRYAADFHIGYPHGLYPTSELLTAEGLHGSWGLWHEMGHQRQQSWTWGAVIEVTVNTFSLAVLRATPDVPATAPTVGHGTVPEWDGTWEWLQKPLEQRNFSCTIKYDPPDPNCRYDELFYRMTMFEQLRIVYGDGWAQRLHKLTREQQPSFGDSPDGRLERLHMMKNACTAAGADLSDYFTKWALPDAQDVCASLGFAKPAGDLWQVAAYGGGQKLTTEGEMRLDPPTGRYGKGATVKATATGSGFTGWTLDGQPYGTDAAVVVKMDADRTLVAQYSAAAGEFSGADTNAAWTLLTGAGPHPACLTAGTSTGSLPGCKAEKADQPGTGVLQLNNGATENVSGVLLSQAVPTNNGLHVEFDQFQYATEKKWPGGDGLAFFLTDGAVDTTALGDGGGMLGYKGMKGAALGIAFDQYGGFSSIASGGPGFCPNCVTVRGSEASGHKYLGGGILDPKTRPLSSPGTEREPARRSVTVDVTPAGRLTVSIDFHDGKGGQQVIAQDIPPLPVTVKPGFSSASGHALAVYEVQNFKIG